MNVKTLGAVIRYMIDQAIEAEDKSFTVRLRDIARAITGINPKDFTYEEMVEFEKVKGLKSSYIYNTAARVQRLQELNLRAKYEMVFVDEDGEVQSGSSMVDGLGYKAMRIFLVDGAVKPVSRAKADSESEAMAVERFKSRLLKLSPSVAGLEGDELKGAVSMINAYQEMIKETK